MPDVVVQLFGAVITGVAAQLLTNLITKNDRIRTGAALVIVVVVGTAFWYILTEPRRIHYTECSSLWSQAQAENTITSYRNFIEPCGDHYSAGTARSRIEGLCQTRWQQATRENNVAAYEGFARECADSSLAQTAAEQACDLRLRTAEGERSENALTAVATLCPQHAGAINEALCELRWADAVQRDTTDAYAEFTAACSASPRVQEVAQRSCAARWRDVVGREDVAAYRDFLERCPTYELADQATARIGALCDSKWAEAREQRNLPTYQSFAADCPDSRFYAEAVERIEGECNDLWRRVNRQDRVQAYQDFVRACPNTRHADEARFQIIRATADKITRDYALIYQGCQVYVHPNLSPERQQDAIEDATRECRRQAQRARGGGGPGIAETIFAVIVGVCAAGGC